MTTQNAVNTSLSGQTGTGAFVGATSPTLVTPTLGAATATSINFGGSTLSNYVSETSWTPVFTFGTPGDLSVSYSIQYGGYTRIGSLLFYSFGITCTPTFTTASGNLEVTGLPITVSASYTTPGTVMMGASTFNISSYTWSNSLANAGTTILTFQVGGKNLGIANISVGVFASGTSVTIEGSGFYFI